MAALAFGEGVGSPSRPVVEPVGDVRELSRFSFRVTTPLVSATQDPLGERLHLEPRRRPLGQRYEERVGGKIGGSGASL